MKFKLLIAALIFLVACGSVFAEENEPDWETSIKAQAKALRMPWKGPFANTISVDPGIRVTHKEYNKMSGNWFYGGGGEVESFYKKHLLGESLPIEFGFRGYYNSYKTMVTTDALYGFAGRATRIGWSYIDGVSAANSNGFLLPADVVQIRVSRKIKDFGVDLIGRREISMQSGKLQLMSGPSFFRMTQRTEMFAYDTEDRKNTRPHQDPAYKNMDTVEFYERIESNYYGIKVGVDLALPVSEDFTFLVGANVGGYVLDAFYTGYQHSDISYDPSPKADEPKQYDRSIWVNNTVFSYTSEVEAGIEYDTGFGTIGLSGAARYLSKVPLVEYIKMGVDVTQDYEPAHLNFADAYSFGANIEYKILF